MAEQITLFMKSGCPHCFNAKRDFEARGVEYVEHNVKEDKAALAEMLELNGGRRQVPTIVEGDSVTVGFKGGY
jgi:glutaredoxin